MKDLLMSTTAILKSSKSFQWIGNSEKIHVLLKDWIISLAIVNYFKWIPWPQNRRGYYELVRPSIKQANDQLNSIRWGICFNFLCSVSLIPSFSSQLVQTTYSAEAIKPVTHVNEMDEIQLQQKSN